MVLDGVKPLVNNAFGKVSETSPSLTFLFGASLPDAVPILGRGCSAKGGDAGKEFEGGAIVLFDLQASAKTLFGTWPLLLTVVIESDGEGRAKFGGGGIELAYFRKKLVNANGFGFAVDGHKIDLSGFDFQLGQAVALFVDDEIGPVDFVHAFQARGNIDSIADDGERFCGGGADGANEGVAGG